VSRCGHAVIHALAYALLLNPGLSFSQSLLYPDQGDDSRFFLVGTKGVPSGEEFAVAVPDWRQHCLNAELRHRCEVRLKNEMILFGLRSIRNSLKGCAGAPLVLHNQAFSLDLFMDDRGGSTKILWVRNRGAESLSELLSRHC
jgi:hypothetical protein